MRRYKRQGYYNYDKKQWQAYYKNKDGKIILDRNVKDYKSLRKVVAKNAVKRPDDLLTKKESLVFYPEIHTNIQDQKRAEKLLKKKRLTAQEKQELKNLSLSSGYKKEKISKRTKGIKKPKVIQYYEREIPAVYFSSTSTGFYIPEIMFKQIRREIKQTFKGMKPDRLQVDLDGFKGEINYKDMSSLDKFENAVSGTLSGYGKIDWQKGKSKFRLSLIKR